MDSGTSPSERGVLGGCSTVVYSHFNSCVEFRKAISSRILTSETTDSVFKMVARCRAQRSRLVMSEKNVRSRRNTLSSLQVESPSEDKKRSTPASSELRSCLKTAISDRRSKKRTIDQLILSCLFEEQHHLAAHGQPRFHIQRVFEIRSPLIPREHTTMEQPRVTYQGLPLFREDRSICRDILTPAMRMVMDLLGQMRGNGSD